MHTTAFWYAQELDLDPSVPSAVVQNALNGVAHLLLNTAPLELMCEPGDLGVVAQVKSPFTQLPTIYVYEKYPGGVGYAKQLFDLSSSVLERAYQLLMDCGCEQGCPSCIGPQVDTDQAAKQYSRLFLEEALRHGSQPKA